MREIKIRTKWIGLYIKCGFWFNGKLKVFINIFNIKRGEKECSICLSEKIEVLILPCKHYCMCFDCC